jgi:hypothetical protein
VTGRTIGIAIPCLDVFGIGDLETKPVATQQ